MSTSPTDESPLRRRLEFAAKAFIVTSFVGVLAAGALRLEQRAKASREHRVDLSSWTVLRRPAWSTLDDVRAIRAESGVAGWANLFDTAALAGLDARLSRPVMVRRVASVRRAYPNRVEAVLELRRPAVAVRLPGKAELYVESDEEGVALSRPVPQRPVREARPMRVVVGAVGPVPAPGRAFGPDVVAAASIAESLDSFADEKGRDVLAWLDRIDVSNWGGRLRPGASEVCLDATPAPAQPGPAAAKTSRCVVEWGRAGERELDGHEMPFDAKASHTLQALRLFPRLEGLKTVRVAFADLVVVPDAKAPPAQLTRALEIDGGVQSK